VIAMTLMALIGVSLAGVIVVGARSASSAERKTEQARRYRVATELIVRQLRSTAALELPTGDDEGDEKAGYFIGESDRVSFITATPQSPASSGLAVVELWLEDEVLMMSEVPFFILASDGEVDPKFEAMTFSAPLLYDVGRLTFQFQGSDIKDEDWEDSWDAAEEDALPAAVRIEIEPALEGGPSWYHEVPVFVAALNGVTGEDHFAEPES
jgi:hypothetical protein